MYGYNNEFPYGYTMDNVEDHFALPNNLTAFSSATTLPSPPMAITHNDCDTISPLKTELCYSYSSSGCSSYGSPTSLTSYATNNNNNSSSSFLQRSISNLSLQKNVEGLSPFVSSPPAYAAVCESSSVRKVYSTGDLQEVNPRQLNHRLESPLSSEVSIIESMNKACRYSPEEKKERIERYRSKRNLRNFNKKVKYECRKTLADSRPRIRGRFARNDEIEKTSQNEWGHDGTVEEEDDHDGNWLNFLDAYSVNFIP